LLGRFVFRELMETAFNTDKKAVRVPHFSNLYSNYVNVFSHEGEYRREPKPQVTVSASGAKCSEFGVAQKLLSSSCRDSNPDFFAAPERMSGT
jgi:hypothetical protein